MPWHADSSVLYQANDLTNHWRCVQGLHWAAATLPAARRAAAAGSRWARRPGQRPPISSRRSGTLRTPAEARGFPSRTRRGGGSSSNRSSSSSITAWGRRWSRRPCRGLPRAMVSCTGGLDKRIGSAARCYCSFVNVLGLIEASSCVPRSPLLRKPCAGCAWSVVMPD